jgi:hypothetical protein
MLFISFSFASLVLNHRQGNQRTRQRWPSEVSMTRRKPNTKDSSVACFSITTSSRHAQQRCATGESRRSGNIFTPRSDRGLVCSNPSAAQPFNRALPAKTIGSELRRCHNFFVRSITQDNISFTSKDPAKDSGNRRDLSYRAAI